MKKRIPAVLLASILIFSLAPVFSVAGNAISVLINGEPVNFADQNPTVVDGRTLVPVRGVFEELGFDVQWNAATSQVTLTGNDVVVITIGSNVFTTNGVSSTLDVPAQTIGGRTMLPLRLVLESVGYSLDWDTSTQTVLISTGSEPAVQSAFSGVFVSESYPDLSIEFRQNTFTILMPHYMMDLDMLDGYFPISGTFSIDEGTGKISLTLDTNALMSEMLDLIYALIALDADLAEFMADPEMAVFVEYIHQAMLDEISDEIDYLIAIFESAVVLFDADSGNLYMDDDVMIRK